jgi:hypothetical protein
MGKLLSISGVRAGRRVGFRDPRSLWPEPRDMNLLVFEHVQPHIRSPLGRLHHDPACGGDELRKDETILTVGAGSHAIYRFIHLDPPGSLTLANF